MNDLQHVLSDISAPVFIVTEDQIISLVNDAVLRRCRNVNPTGKQLNELIYFADKKSSSSPAWFSDDWFDLTSKTITWKGSTYSKITLRRRKSVPTQETLLTVQNMIAVLLNRLRSPLTGLQGYTELIGNDQGPGSLFATTKSTISASAPTDGKPVIDDLSSEPLVDEARSETYSDGDKKTRGQRKAWYSRVYDGVQQLFDILDDLEAIHHRLSRSNRSTSTFQSWPDEIVDKVLLNYTTEERKRVRYSSSVPRAPLRCHPSVLESIVSILIENALENTLQNEIMITLESPTPNSIRVSNRGPVIPDEILNHLYFPFVTSKSNKLGLGLTMAQMIASRQGALLYLSENSSEKGITFTLCMPPEKFIVRNL